MKILVAERDPVFRRMLESMLVHWGYEVVCASDGAKALALLEAGNAPEIALLDSALPAIDGFGLSRTIRAAGPPVAATYVIMLLRRLVAIRDVFAASLDAGADDYICKPFDPEELRARLRMGLHAMALRNQAAVCEHDASESAGNLKEPQNPALAASGSAEPDYGKNSIQAALATH